MWHNNKSVVSVYAHVNTKLGFAIVEGLSGWKRINRQGKRQDCQCLYRFR